MWVREFRDGRGATAEALEDAAARRVGERREGVIELGLILNHSVHYSKALGSRAVRGAAAERFVVLNLRLLAGVFALVGVLFIVAPDGVLGTLDDLGEGLPLGAFSPSPETLQQLWLALGFSYMVVITGICLVVQADVVRYRPLLLVLAVGKTASSLVALGAYLFDDDVFPYLLNFLVDGFLVIASLVLWALAGRVGSPAAPG